MATVFFKRKYLSVVAVATALLFSVVVGLYAFFLNGLHYYPLEKSFYFLVDNSTHIDACVATSTLQGGAGYIVDDGTREYSAMSVYLTKSAGEVAQSGLVDERSYSLLEKRIDGLYFKTVSQKRRKARVLSAFRCLDACIQVLNGEIRRLEDNATQRSTKRVLTDLAKQFIFLAQEYQRDFSNYAIFCDKVGKILNALTQGIVYARDLRYLCCSVCDGFVQLSNEFAL